MARSGTDISGVVGVDLGATGVPLGNVGVLRLVGGGIVDADGPRGLEDALHCLRRVRVRHVELDGLAAQHLLEVLVQVLHGAQLLEALRAHHGGHDARLVGDVVARNAGRLLIAHQQRARRLGVAADAQDEREVRGTQVLRLLARNRLAVLVHADELVAVVQGHEPAQNEAFVCWHAAASPGSAGWTNWCAPYCVERLANAWLECVRTSGTGFQCSRWSC